MASAWVSPELLPEELVPGSHACVPATPVSTSCPSSWPRLHGFLSPQDPQPTPALCVRWCRQHRGVSPSRSLCFPQWALGAGHWAGKAKAAEMCHPPDDETTGGRGSVLCIFKCGCFSSKCYCCHMNSCFQTHCSERVLSTQMWRGVALTGSASLSSISRDHSKAPESGREPGPHPVTNHLVAATLCSQPWGTHAGAGPASSATPRPGQCPGARCEWDEDHSKCTRLWGLFPEVR